MTHADEDLPEAELNLGEPVYLTRKGLLNVASTYKELMTEPGYEDEVTERTNPFVAG